MQLISGVIAAAAVSGLALIASITSCSVPISAVANLSDDDWVMIPDPDRAPLDALAEFGGLPARILSASDSGRKVAELDTPPGWRFDFPADRSYALELLIVAGELDWQTTPLRQYDFAYLPAAAPPPSVSGIGVAKLLLFFDPSRATDGDVARTVQSTNLAWRGGVVAQRDTGQALKLEVKDLLTVAETGQRTWLLRAGADLQVPWERHNSVEEGYLLSGQYRLVECLAKSPVAMDYATGGYFYRPRDIIHSGPDSGAVSAEVLWLLRTPQRLEVEFVENCQAD